MTATVDAILQSLCRELKIPTVGSRLPGLVQRAQQEGWSYPDFLVQVLECEVIQRQDRSSQRRLKAAGFPEMKTLDSIDWEFLQGVSRQKVNELASCEFIDGAQDVILAGPIGTGKTMIANAVGLEATRRRFNVIYKRTADLVRELIEAQNERRLGQLQAHYRKVPLLILDELGFVPFDRYGAELLFNMLSDRYRKRSTIVTTNLSFGEWVQVFGCEKMTAALLDRLTHHSHILVTSGPSYRSIKRQEQAKGKSE
jgi:DNA replication protein DnaC